MRTILKSLFALLFTLAALPGFSAEVETHVVKKGEYLIKIAKKYPGVSWRAIAKENGITAPWIIEIGERLVLPKGTSAERRATIEHTRVHADHQKVFLWKHPGGEKCVGCTLPESLRLLDYPEDVQAALSDLVKNETYETVVIKKGDRFDAMLFGEKKLRQNTIAYWREGHVEPARKYTVVKDGKEYALYYPLVCGNWARAVSTAPPSDDRGAREEPAPPLETTPGDINEQRGNELPLFFGEPCNCGSRDSGWYTRARYPIDYVPTF